MAGPRPTWTGSISFGLVNIPVKMYTAVDRAKKIQFNQINKETGNRVIQPKIDSVTKDPVDEIVKGYEVEKDKYILVTDEELEALTPDKTSSIELVSFIDEDDIDSIYFDEPYHLGANDGGEKSYSLLDEALRAKGKIAIGKFVMRSKEYLCAIRPVGDKGLAVSTLRWHDQLRANEDIVPDGVEVSDQEIEFAGQLIDNMSSDFDITVLKDTYTDELRSLIEQKASGEAVVVTPEPEKTEDGLPPNLIEALEASLALSKQNNSDKEAV